MIRPLSEIPSTRDPNAKAEHLRQAAADRLAERVVKRINHKPALQDIVSSGDIEAVLRKLTDRQRSFVNEYLVDLDKTAACRRAGYKSKHMSRQADDLLQNPAVRLAIDILKAERNAKSDVTSDYVLKKIVKIVEDCNDREKATALRGLELLGRHLSMFVDRTEISGKDGEAIKLEETKKSVESFTSTIAGLTARAGKAGVSLVSDTGTDG